MSNIFAEWDKNINDDFLNDITAQETNKTPYGVYECKLSTLEIVESKAGKPMVKGVFEIVNSRRKIYTNQIIEKPFQVSLAKKLLKSLDTDIDITFESYSQFNDLCGQVKQSAEDLKLTFEVSYTQDKGYDKVEVRNVFEN